MLRRLLKIKGPNNLGPGILKILPIFNPRGTISNNIKQSINFISKFGHEGTLSKEPGKKERIKKGTVKTVKKILII